MRSRALARRVTASCIVTALVALTSCAGTDAGGPAGDAAAESLFQVCPGPAPDGWSAVKGAPGEAVAKGSGPVVILANDLTNAVCGLMPLAARLLERHYRVVLFHYPDTTPEGERRATAQTLEVAARAASGQPFVMVGASFGGRIVIEAAAQHPDGLRAIVSVSGEAEDNAWRNILGDARGVTVPALYVGARHDQFTEGTRQQRALHRAMRGSPNLRVELAGPGHGTDLLDPTTAVGRAGLRQVVAFVGRVLPSGSR